MPWCVGQNCCLFSLQIGFPPSLLNQTLSLLLIGFFFFKQKTFLLTLALKSVCRLHQNSSISCILCCAKGRGRSWCAGSGHCQPTVGVQLGTCEMLHRCHCCPITGTTGTLWSPALWHWAICWHGGPGAPELWYIWVCAEHLLLQCSSTSAVSCHSGSAPQLLPSKAFHGSAARLCCCCCCRGESS